MNQTPPRQPGRHLRELASQPCPRCNGIYEKGALECGTCGLIFSKMKKPGETAGLASSALLESEWQKILENYENEVQHLAFIEQGLVSQNMVFVSQKYRHILEANPNDQIAVRMRDLVIQKVTVTYLNRMSGRSEPVSPLARRAIFLVVGVGLSAAILGLVWLVLQLRH